MLVQQDGMTPLDFDEIFPYRVMLFEVGSTPFRLVYHLRSYP